MKRLRGLPCNVLLALAAAAATLVAAEAAVRRLLPGTALLLEALRVHAYSEALGWVPRPGARGRIAGAWVTINPAGYRGPLHGPQPAPGAQRVVMLGDSVAFGHGVPDGTAFSDLLDREPGLEVVNLSVIGYGTDQALIRLEREGLRYSPHVVVLNFCLSNDFIDNVRHDTAYLKPYFTLVGGQLRMVDAHLKLTPLRRAHLWLSVNSVLYGAARRLGRGRPPHDPPEPQARAVGLAVRLMERMEELSGGAGARFLVLLHPAPADFTQGHRIERLLEACPPGLDVRDLRPVYGHDGIAFARVADDHGHLNEEGHRHLARALRAMLR